MKVFTVDQIRAIDERTIEREPISSLDLMERASKEAAQWILRKFPKNVKIKVLAGKGNNGGDGLAVARLLSAYGYKVSVFLALGKDGSDDFNKNLHRIEHTTVELEGRDAFLKIKSERKYVYLDALFGSGLSRPIEGDLASLVAQVNNLKATRIAIDIASGLYADQPSTGAIVKVDHTLSFQFPKLAFFAPENFPFVGIFHILDIGLLPEAINAQDTQLHYIDGYSFFSKVTKVNPFAHKGERGRVTVIAGSYAAMGAAVLVLKGALHSGVGLLTAQTCRKTTEIVQNAVPEALIKEDENDFVLGSYLNYDNQEAVVVGPAIGFAAKTRKLLEELLRSYDGQLILDADALTHLAENNHLLELLPENAILTPHPGEFKRLVGDYSNFFEGIMQLKRFAVHHKVVVVLKGRHTAICSPSGEISFNSTGNSGMAKGGSGDLLSGILAGVYLTEKNPFKAAQLAVFLHGKAGDLALVAKGEEQMSPLDLVSYLGEAYDGLGK